MKAAGHPASLQDAAPCNPAVRVSVEFAPGAKGCLLDSRQRGTGEKDDSGSAKGVGG
jgi:hypothetical protein